MVTGLPIRDSKVAQKRLRSSPFFSFPLAWLSIRRLCSCVGLDDDGKNRELRRSSEASPTVASKIEAIYESSADLCIQDIASGALDIISKIEALTMPTVLLGATTRRWFKKASTSFKVIH